MFGTRQMEAAALELFEQMQNKPEDAHEIQLKLRRLLAKMRASAMPVPEDLARLERELDRTFEREAASGGNASR